MRESEECYMHLCREISDIDMKKAFARHCIFLQIICFMHQRHAYMFYATISSVQWRDNTLLSRPLFPQWKARVNGTLRESLNNDTFVD